MSLMKKELTEKSGFVLEFSVSKEAFDKAEEAAYRKNVKKMNVPGFRKGKAPKYIIKKLYGEGVFFEDAVNACLPEAFEEAVQEAGITVVGTPSFDIVSTEGDLVLKAVGFVKPEVTIEGYKGIVAERKVARVTKKEIDEEIERVRKRNARTIEITDRAAKKKDIVNIDYTGTVDGEEFAGGKAEKYDLTLGSGSFIPGFEEQIVGKKIGSAFDVTVTFPEDYHATELSGKEAVFHVVLNGIKFEELPALDDEFAKDVSEFDTLDEYKADIKEKLTKRNEKTADDAFESALLDALAEKVVAEIPEVMYTAEVENMVRDYDSRLRMQGLDLATYFKYTGQSLEDLRTQLRPQAEKQVKVRLALEKIAVLEALTVSNEELEAEYTRIAEAYNVPVEQVKSSIPAEDLKLDLLNAAALKLVKAKAAKPAKKAKVAADTDSDSN